MRDRCDREEDIVRAICDPAHYDREKQRISSCLFRQKDISVSRLAVLPLNELFIIFFDHLNKGNSTVMAAGQINVGRLIDIAQDKGYDMFVEIDPLPAKDGKLPNPAHAEIPGDWKSKSKRALAKAIIDELQIHDAPT